MQTTLYLPQKNKSFHMVLDAAENIIKITFGEIGKRQFVKTRPAEDWDKIINEKKQNGYTEIFTKESNEAAEEANVVTRADDVIQLLKTISKHIVDEGYKLSPQYLSDENIARAKDGLLKLSQLTNLYSFNQQLFELFSIIPRKMSRPILYTARSEKDFTSILQRESDLLDNLGCYSIDADSIRLTECTKKETQEIMSLFDDVISKKVNGIYLVNNIEQQENYQKYIEDNKIKNHRLLFHGSRNENWWSIINNGLKTNPVNVVISGKMFGNGIYFADSSDKSAGYTSLRTARHTDGNSNRAFLGIYDVALGNPMQIHKWDYSYTNLDEAQIKANGFDSVHAYKGVDLVHDEMIVYNNYACCLKYLVELRE